MATDNLITEDLSKLVGAQQGILICKVEEGSVIRYAQAIGDPNPLFNDPEYAKTASMAGLSVRRDSSAGP